MERLLAWLHPGEISVLAIALVVGVLSPWISLLSVLSLAVYFVAILTSALILLVELATFIGKKDPWRGVKRVLATTIVSVALFLVCAPAARSVDDWFDLQSAKRRLPPILDRAIVDCTTRPDGYSSSVPGRHIVECGPPIRVAFELGGGFLDNWHGIVFDPSGVVETARTNMRSLELDPPGSPTKHFGGDIVWCKRLEGDFFHCRFT